MRLAIKITSLAIVMVTMMTTLAAPIAETNDFGFQSTISQSTKYVLVEFIKEGCDDCESVQDILEGIASTYEATLSVVSLDTGKNLEKATQFGVNELPALVLFHQGIFLAAVGGNKNKDEIRTFLNNNHVMA